MTKEEIDRLKYMICCPMCDNERCVRGSDRCEAEIWAKNKKAKDNKKENMIDETKLEEFVKEKCSELSNTLDVLNYSKSEFFKSAEDIKDSDYVSCWSEHSLSELRECSIQYNERKFMLSELVQVLGDKYVKIYKNFFKET